MWEGQTCCSSPTELTRQLEDSKSEVIEDSFSLFCFWKLIVSFDPTFQRHSGSSSGTQAVRP